MKHAARRTLGWIGALMWVYCVAIFATPAVHASDNVEVSYANANVERWRCRRCPIEEDRGKREITIGAHYTTDREARFGRDNGLADIGLEPLASLSLDERLDPGRLTIRSRELGLDSRRFDAAWRGERGRLRVTWREIPRVDFFDGHTPLSPGVEQTLPNGWVRSFSTDGMTAFDSLARTVDARTDRRRLEIAGTRSLTSHLTWFARIELETKKGARLRGVDTIYQPIQLLEPIDRETNTFSTGLTLSSTSLRATGWIDRSSFDSDVPGIRFDNPYASFFDFGAVGSATSTEMERFGVSFRFMPFRTTRVTARLVWGEESQDDLIGSPVIEGDPVALGLHADRFDGRMHLTSRLGKRLRVSTSFRFRERDIDEGTLDGFAPATARLFELQDSAADMRLRYRTAWGMSLEGGWRERDSDRPLQEQANLDETGYWLKLRLPVGPWQLAVAAERDDRDAGSFERITNNHPATRRFHLADRERQRLRTRLSYSAGPVDVAVYRDELENEFDASLLGLSSQESATHGVEFDWRLGNHGMLSAFFTVDELESLTFGTSDFVNFDWQSRTDDEVTTWGFNWQFERIGGAPLDAGIHISSSDGIADYTTTWLGAASPLPRLVADQETIRIDLAYAVTAKSRVFLRMFHERFRSADWAVDNVAHDTIPNLLSFGLVSPNYRVTSFALGWRWSF